jgi:hypothetical protein
MEGEDGEARMENKRRSKMEGIGRAETVYLTSSSDAVRCSVLFVFQLLMTCKLAGERVK